MEYKKNESEFQKKLSTLKENNRKKPPYNLPKDLKDISRSDVPKPNSLRTSSTIILTFIKIIMRC